MHRKLFAVVVAVALTAPSAAAATNHPSDWQVDLSPNADLGGYEECYEYYGEFWGMIFCEAWEPFRSQVDATHARLTAGCAFQATLTPANTFIVTFGGTANAVGTQQALITHIECEINNFAAGGSNSQTQGFSMNGPSATTASSTLVAPGPKEWPVLGITVCVSAFVVYGPTPITTLDVGRNCTTPTFR